MYWRMDAPCPSLVFPRRTMNLRATGMARTPRGVGKASEVRGPAPGESAFDTSRLPSIEQPTAARRRPARDVAPGAHPSLDHVAPDAHVQKRRIELTQRSVRELRSGSLASVLAGFGGSDSPTARASAATLTAARTVTVRSLKACLAATFFICSSCRSTHVAGRITTIYGETR